MNYSKDIKTAAAIFLALLALQLTPSAFAEAGYPPSGKYHSMLTESVVYYDSVTHSVTPAPDEVFPFECPEYAPMGSNTYCGNCEYVPGQSAWELPATQYTYGRCINLDTTPPPLEPVGVMTFRVDVRLLDSVSLNYGYMAWVSTYGYYLGDYIGTKEAIAPTACDKALTGTDAVFSCPGIPRNVDLREFRSGNGDALCLEIQIIKQVPPTASEHFDDAFVWGCTFA